MKGFLYYAEEIDLSDATRFIPQKTIREQISTEKQERIDAAKRKLDNYNTQLQELNSSQSSDIKGSFEKYELLTKQYHEAIRELEMAVAESKYTWLSDGKKYVDVRKDFKVQRATEGATFKLDNIFFDLGKATLKDESKPGLDKLFDILTKNPINIELGGHTDSIGTDESNSKLSQERVNSVKNYLLNKGIAANRISAVGYGESRPVATNNTDEGRAQNRRVEVKITDNRPIVRVGTEIDLVEKKESKKAEVKEPEKISNDLDLLSTLQMASKLGGLPEGSMCGDNKTYNMATYNSTVPKTTQKKSTYSPSKTSSSSSEFDKSDYIYKGLSLGAENFAFKDRPAHLGVNMRFTKLKNLPYHGKASEYNFVYYLGRDTAQWGLGYQYMHFRSFKESIGLPIGLLIGFETRAFIYHDTTLSVAADPYWRGYMGMPIGIRALINVNDLIISPSIYYHLALLTFKYDQDLGKKANYLVIGSNVRWKFLYGGAHLNLGKGVQYFGLNAGLTF